MNGKVTNQRTQLTRKSVVDSEAMVLNFDSEWFFFRAVCHSVYCLQLQFQVFCKSFL